MLALDRVPIARRRNRRCAGTSLLETVLMMVLLTALLAASITIAQGARHAYEAGRVRATLQENGRSALDELLDDLRRSGLTASAGQNLPAVWERAAALDADSERGALIATMAYQDVDLVNEVLAYNGDGSRVQRNRDRVSDEIVFQLPQDRDGDGSPLDSRGDLEWGDDWISYRVIVESSGIPWLVRVVENAGVEVQRQRIAPWVQSMTCDVVFNDRSVRFGTVAVVLYLARPGHRGEQVEIAFEGSVMLRNTREL